jgi:phosphoribosylformimino-5-aminoimidazole carboxamide ribotide isomerase
VRLRRGVAEDATVYSTDPEAMARHWVEEGATYLHVVDLDGAFAGRPAHTELIGRMAKTAGVPIEVGGGLRRDEDVAAMIESGVDRVILGTRAAQDMEAVRRLASRFGPRVAVGIDSRDGKVQVKGWVETTEIRAVDLARRIEKAGVRTLIVTDTATDGMLQGVNADGVAAVCRNVSCDVIASGGIASARDAALLLSLGCANLTGAIVGKALYDGRVTLRALMAASRGEAP